MIAGGDKQKAGDLQDEWMHRLGGARLLRGLAVMTVTTEGRVMVVCDCCKEEFPAGDSIPEVWRLLTIFLTLGRPC